MQQQTMAQHGDTAKGARGQRKLCQDVEGLAAHTWLGAGLRQPLLIEMGVPREQPLQVVEQGAGALAPLTMRSERSSRKPRGWSGDSTKRETSQMVIDPRAWQDGAREEQGGGSGEVRGALGLAPVSPPLLPLLQAICTRRFGWNAMRKCVVSWLRSSKRASSSLRAMRSGVTSRQVRPLSGEASTVMVPSTDGGSCQRTTTEETAMGPRALSTSIS